MPIDAIDRQILKVLQNAARTPLSELAKIVGRSRTAVQNRISRLEREGIIRGYRAELRGGGGQRAIGTMIIVHLQDRTAFQRVADSMRGIPEVIGCYMVTGLADLVITLEVMERERLAEVCEPLWRSSVIRQTETMMVLKSELES